MAAEGRGADGVGFVWPAMVGFVWRRLATCWVRVFRRVGIGIVLESVTMGRMMGSSGPDMVEGLASDFRKANQPDTITDRVLK